MKWVVLKFGGTSVSTKKTWDVIVARVKDLLKEEEDIGVWIVVSAVSQVTNRLVKVLDSDLRAGGKEDFLSWFKSRHEELLMSVGLSMEEDEGLVELFTMLSRLLDGIELTGDSASSRLRAKVLGFGERVSSRIGCLVLNKYLNPDGQSCAWVDASKLLISHSRMGEQDEDKYLNADVKPHYDREKAEAEIPLSTRVVITQGFIASTGKEGELCVLGRGGSDTSGALFSALLGAERYEIWTDVHGMFTSDPRSVKRARHIKELSYREAQELAAMGAKVLHPRCLGPAAAARVPVEIHNTMDPSQRDKCTRIVDSNMLQDKKTTVMAITRRLEQVLITLQNIEMWGASGFLSKAFAPFERLGISVDLIATSQYTVTVTLDHIPGGVKGDAFANLIAELNKIAIIEVHTSCAVVSIVGRKLRTVLHEMADAFKELAQYKVLLLSESSEDLNLSFVIDQSASASTDKNIDDLVASLHHALLENKDGALVSKSPSLFGSTLSELLNLKASPSTSTGMRSPSTSIGNLMEPLDLRGACEFPQPAPCVVVDVKALSSVGTGLALFPLSFSESPLVLRTVHKANPEIVFQIYKPSQLVLLHDLIGDAVKVVYSKGIETVLRVAASQQPQVYEHVLRNVTVVEQFNPGSETHLCSCKTVIATVLWIDEKAKEIGIDVFWDSEANPKASASMRREQTQDFKTFSVVAYNPHAPVSTPRVLLQNASLSADTAVGEKLFVKGIEGIAVTANDTLVEYFEYN